MSKVNAPLLAFNRGIISPLALARVDVQRTGLSAETMTNWLPKTQGAMRIRPGTKHLASSRNDTGAEFIEFIASTDTGIALVELTPLALRVIDGQGTDTGNAIITRPTRATAAISDFNTDTGVWRLGDTGLSHGGTIGFGDTGLILNARYPGTTVRAQRKLALGDTGDLNVEIGLKINVARGPVTFYAGNDTGKQNYFARSELRTGHYSLAIKPTDTGGIHLTFETTDDVDRIVKSIDFDDTGPMVVTTPISKADLDNIRYTQSADVVFVARFNARQLRIERRGKGRSWGISEYRTIDGPFFSDRTAKVRLKPGASFGNTTLTADADIFDTGHDGGLFRVRLDGQSGQYRFTHKDSFSDVWQVTGINDTGNPGERNTKVIITDTGTFNGKLRLQRSFEGAESGFRTTDTFTAATTYSEDDPDDNVTAFYRLAMLGDTGDHIKGALNARVVYTNGSKDGVCRVTKYNSPTSVNIEVLSRFATGDTGTDTGAVPFSDDWAEGRWSDAQTFPSSVELHDGRLWWFGGARLYGSVPDDFENFNAGTIGDSAPIVRTLARGPVDRIHAAISLLRLFIFTASEEIAIRASTQDEPITPTNMTAKSRSSQGSANLRVLNIDDKAVFINRAKNRLFMLAFNVNANDYLAQELSLMAPDLLSGVTSIAVQRQPDTRIHMAMDDGTVALLTYQDQEQVACWSLWKSTAADGFVERVNTLPGTVEDHVYYHIRRTINGVTKRYIERWATEAESNGDTGASFIMDCAVERTISDTGVANNLSHLEAEKTVIWAARDLSSDDTGGEQTTYTVASGNIQLGTSDTGFGAITAQIGLPFIKRINGDENDAEYKSTKLAYAAAAGSALTMPKRVDHVGLVLGPTHNRGLFFGPNLIPDNMRPLPRVVAGRVLNDTGQDKDEIFTAQEFAPIEFPGDFDTDSRLCLAAKAPRPCTLLAAIVGMATNDII